MSNEIFPSLPGLKWNQGKTPVFSTLIQVAASGRESRIPLYVYPLYEFDLSYELLRDDTAHNELKNLAGFYLHMGGANNDFLYLDPSDNYILGSFIGTGDGNANSFQLIRIYGNSIEPRYDIQQSNNSVPIKIYFNGNQQANNSYSITYLKSGLLTFAANNTPPPTTIITADFSYYYRVRFIEYGVGDKGFSQFMKNLWEARSLSFHSVRQEGNVYFPDPPNVQMIVVLLRNVTNNLYQGVMANDPSTAGWNSVQLGYWWLNTSDPHYKWWNGNEILILG